MEDSSSLKPQGDPEVSFKIPPPEEWEELIANWAKLLPEVDIERFNKQWMEHPNKAQFINWKDASIENGGTMLICAIWAGRLDIAQLLLENGADINIADEDGDTPLINCADNGYDAVKLLVDKGADVNVGNKVGDTVLMRASNKGDSNAVNLLLEKGADINVGNEYGNTALIFASAENGNYDTVKLLLEKGADINIANSGGWTAVMYALGFYDIAKLLLENGADTNIADKDGETVVMLATKGGHVDIVKLLLQKGADISVADKDGWTALMWAIEQGHDEIAKLLLEKGDTDINNANKVGETAVMMATKDGRNDIVKLLLDKGADISVADKDGNTALMLASRHGHDEIVELLLEKVVDISITNNGGWTAMRLALKSGHTKIVGLFVEKGADMTEKERNTASMSAAEKGLTETMELLVDKGADPNIANQDGVTALMKASENGHTDTVALLVDRGADVDVADKDGKTALLKATKNRHTDTVKFLVDKGADINTPDNNGMTPLLKATKNGHTDAVELLVDKGADITIANKNGWTALMLASRGSHTKIVELLLEKGADCRITNNQGRTAFTEAYYQGRTKVVALLLDKAPLKDIIHDIVKFPQFANKFLELFQENRDIVHWRDGEGRTVRQMACKECREAILFLGRFDVDDQPMYESPTCKIYKALDYGSSREEDLKQPRRVAMKFMEEEDHFLNEIRTRRNDDDSPRFSSEFVTPDLAAFRSDQDPEYAEACKTFNLPKYCLVMPLAERSLMEAMNNEYLSAPHKDLQRREILSTLCKIFSYLHTEGYIHGDIKPHNVVRHIVDGNVAWKAIDFDACTKIGDVVGLKLTTGSVPPEMLKIVNEKDDAGDAESMGKSQVVLRQRGGGLDESQLVQADASFDVWSFGILMYQLVTGGSFFHCDLQGNVVDAGLQDWANLTQALINEKLASVNDVDARVLLSRILRLDPEDRPTMSEIEKDYYFHPSESPQGRKSEFIGKQVFSIFVPQSDATLKFGDMAEDGPFALEATETNSTEKDDDGDSGQVEDLKIFLSSKSEFSYFKLRDEDKDWSDKLLNSEVETFHFDELGGMGEKPKFIDGDSIYHNKFLKRLVSSKGPDYFMGFLVEYFQLYKIMHDAHEVCQGIKANLVSDVKSLKGIFIKLFVRGKGLNDIVRGTLFCNSIEQFKYVGRQLKEQYGHNVYIKPPKKEAGAWPIPKLLIYGQNRIDGRCMSVEIQFSTVYMHLALHASNNHLVYEAIRESTGYLNDKNEEFQEFLQSLNHQYIDTEGFLRNQSVQEGRFEILLEQADDSESGETHTSQESDKQYTTKATGFILSGRVRCGDQLFRFLKSKDDLQKFSESSFIVNKNLTLLSSHSYWSEELYDLEGKVVEFVVSFSGRGMAIAGIGTAKCFHGSAGDGGERCSVHVSRSKFVVRKSGVEEVFREKKLPNQERAKIIFRMHDGVLMISFVGSERESNEETESVQISMPSNQRYYIYMRAPPGVHDVKFHDINILI